jgi:hypothetical protein
MEHRLGQEVEDVLHHDGFFPKETVTGQMAKMGLE